MSRTRSAAVEADCVEDVDVGAEDDVCGVRVPGKRRPAGRRAAVLAVARPRIRSMLQQDRHSLGIAMECGRMQRGISGRAIDRGLPVVFHVHNRQA